MRDLVAENDALHKANEELRRRLKILQGEATNYREWLYQNSPRWLTPVEALVAHLLSTNREVTLALIREHDLADSERPFAKFGMQSMRTFSGVVTEIRKKFKARGMPLRLKKYPNGGYTATPEEQLVLRRTLRVP